MGTYRGIEEGWVTQKILHQYLRQLSGSSQNNTVCEHRDTGGGGGNEVGEGGREGETGVEKESVSLTSFQVA